MAVQATVTNVFFEKTDQTLSMTGFKDKAGTNLEQSNIATMTVQIDEENNGTVVKASLDVRNAGAWDQGYTISAGTMTMLLTPTDTTIVDTTLPGKHETHVILIQGTTSGSPSEAFKFLIDFKVQDLVKVTYWHTFRISRTKYLRRATRS